MKGLKHIAFFYYSDEDWQKTIIPLIKKAINSGEKIIYLYDEHTPEQIRNLLNNGSIKEKLLKHITFIKAEDIYSKGKSFDPTEMIKNLIHETKKAISEGFPSLFATGEMT